MGRHFRHLRELERTRDEASRTLAQIAEESGRDSILYRRCRELWRRREEEAHASIFHGDFENARVILGRGLTALAHGPDALKREGLDLEDAMRLMEAC
ncbi:MAG: hypothetical protein A2V77_12195 [Anaeromyxobacter sp. RBG_16_69_14]|nr:MAG: hypothetical protein A2V77_12195 [Anaeromyxobacter sp. RBG_16_69_14]